MRHFFDLFWQVLKGAFVQFASIIPAMLGFHLVGRFLYHSVPAWLPGCAAGLTITLGLWIWYCTTSGFPVIWALSTLSISTTLWFFLLIALFRGRFILDDHDSICTSDLVVLLASVAIVIYLRHVLIRRNKEADHLLQ
jgi:hypothetical protein